MAGWRSNEENGEREQECAKPQGSEVRFHVYSGASLPDPCSDGCLR